MKRTMNFGMTSLLLFIMIMNFPCVGDHNSTRAITQEGEYLSGKIYRPERSSGETIIVPDEFLRRWDPVTIFFKRGKGPGGGGPEDSPEKYVQMMPEHPGAYRWLDDRTLIFEPAEAWPPLQKFDWFIEGRKFSLSTLMSPPQSALPADKSEGLEPVDSITLTFREPIPTEALSEMITIETAPLPGAGEAGTILLTGEDFSIKTMERDSRASPASYVLNLRNPIPAGMKATVQFQLSLEDKDESFTEITFSTAEPFRIRAAGSVSVRYPIIPEGVKYREDQAITCDPSQRSIVIEFSSSPGEANPVAFSNLIRITPRVEGINYKVQNKQVSVGGKFSAEKLYKLTLAPADVFDEKGNRLEISGISEIYFYFPKQESFLQWKAGSGVMERYGPQEAPVEGRNDERVDIRIHKIDSLNRSFWPFPNEPLMVNESQRPPGPGEKAEPFTVLWRDIYPYELQKQIRSLGSPQVSDIVDIPLSDGGKAATFGLDLREYFESISGMDASGCYLVGLRRLPESENRHWMRVQVTDICLTMVEEPYHVQFVVTSLDSARPVKNAGVRIEGYDRRNRRWTTISAGATDSYGMYRWKAPGKTDIDIRRIVAFKDDDYLVINPQSRDEVYHDNHWHQSYQRMLQWAVSSNLQFRGPESRTLCHIFTERPVYRPEQAVHIKGYIRSRLAGRLSQPFDEGTVIVEGPGDLSWRYPVELSYLGAFYHKFQEDDLPTGTYRAVFEEKNGARHGEVSFRMEAYRIPRFEVRLHCDDEVPLDSEFQVSLTAEYYAGGSVAEHPVLWRVSQYPYDWSPELDDRFVYSSDARYSGEVRFESRPRMEIQEMTDEEGSSSIRIDPENEPTIQPRTYVVEATVTGADDQTVTSVRRIKALPPFILGLNAPRYLEEGEELEPELVVLDMNGKPLPDKEITVRLLRREWHSYLRASNFSDGVPRYITDTVDEKVYETTIESEREPIRVTLPVEQAGVYIIEVESHDRIGRAQTVSSDLYAGGEETVAWEKPKTRIFTVSPDKEKYEPGETANLVLQSPFQKAEILVVMEKPETNQYQWIKVRNGKANFKFPIRSVYVPRIPIHFVLMRGRLEDTGPVTDAGVDLGKPATLAATSWIEVEPVEHSLDIELESPERAQPGDVIDIDIKLSDHRGNPVSGEVTLWLVDQAVLALGREQRLDPVPDFITPVYSFIDIRDTRDMCFGYIPFAEAPGGDVGEAEESGLMQRVTVRKAFQPVPYYNPLIRIGPDGQTTISVELPDNLTNFMIRAKAVSGVDKFGFAKGLIAVRLPLIVQPSLPRFVRPGDRFKATVIGRVVEGEGGDGIAEFEAENAGLMDDAVKTVQWSVGVPERLDYTVEIPDPVYDGEGELITEKVVFRAAVERSADGAADAFEVELPIKPDRKKVINQSLKEIRAGETLTIPAVDVNFQAGTFYRTFLVSSEPALIRMISGLSFLMGYPYGCTEQRISRAQAHLQFKEYRDLLKENELQQRTDIAVRNALDYIPSVIDSHNLCAYWPGSGGYVSLTAWTVEFLSQAQNSGYDVDQEMLDSLIRTLQKALRSDYSHFIDQESWTERCMALRALLSAGVYDASYAAELARRSQFLNLESKARILEVLLNKKDDFPEKIENIRNALWDGLVFRLHQGEEIYSGLESDIYSRSQLILPSETRTLAWVTRALTEAEPGADKLPVLKDALINLGDVDGWGTTNANAAAISAITAFLKPSFQQTPEHSLSISRQNETGTVSLGPGEPLNRFYAKDSGEIRLTLPSEDRNETVIIKIETGYLPAGDASEAAAETKGFVVKRESLIFREKDTPPIKLPLNETGNELSYNVGDIVEEHVQLINPQDRYYVAITVPLAAGMEPLNPNLAVSPPEATPRGTLTLKPSYSAFLDDSAAYYYDYLPKGAYDFYFRTKAAFQGQFIQPVACAEMMYDSSVYGSSYGAKIMIESKNER